MKNTNHSLKLKPLFYSLLSAGLLSGLAHATAVDLDFSNIVEQLDSTAYGGSYSGLDMHFLNVGTHNGRTIDAKMTAEVFGPAEFVYHVPNYLSGPGEPDGDVGFLYRTTGFGPAGLKYRVDFFDGTGGLSSTFQVPYIIHEFEIIAYDIDGEPQQSEEVRVFKSDGFYSYQTSNNPASLSATESPDGLSYLFTGPGQNYSETDTSGAVKFVYKNSSGFTLQFETDTTYGFLPNPIFSAFDGNWDLSNFAEPEPSAEVDFGDAPDTYQTTKANNGPEHGITDNLYLGEGVDAETDGLPSTNADGDDLNITGTSGDDEDGIVLLTNLEKGLDSLLKVTAKGNGFLQGWADWNDNGTFDAGEQIITNYPILDGEQSVNIHVDTEAVLGPVQMRFRLATQKDLPHFGYAGDGEVEDVVFNVTDPGTSIQHSTVYTAAFEDKWPTKGDFDMNDVVTYYRTTLIIKDGKVLRMDINGNVQAYGASYSNGLGWKLEGINRSDVELALSRISNNGIILNKISPFTGEEKDFSTPLDDNGDLVVIASADLKEAIYIDPECVYHRTNPSCSLALESNELTYNVSLTFKADAQPDAAMASLMGSHDPFIFAAGKGTYHGDMFTTPGKELEIHTAGFGPTTQGTLVDSHVNTYDDASDILNNIYYRTGNNLPWGFIIASQWNHPSEYIDISDAYPEFADWATSGGTSNTTWYLNPNADKTWSELD